MGKTLLLYIITTFLVLPQLALASSVAPRHRERCSQTSGAFAERLMGDGFASPEFLADATHLLPHLEIGYAPFERHTSLAIKPSISFCRFELHLVVEVAHSEHELEWRLGAELFTRPSRWLPERWRLLDAIALGIGSTAGLDRTLEFGPRALFDATEWLGFVLAMNIHTRPELGLTFTGAVQISFPSHVLFAHDH